MKKKNTFRKINEFISKSEIQTSFGSVRLTKTTYEQNRLWLKSQMLIFFPFSHSEMMAEALGGENMRISVCVCIALALNSYRHFFCHHWADLGISFSQT